MKGSISQLGVLLAKWQEHSGCVSSKYCLSSQASQKVICNGLLPDTY